MSVNMSLHVFLETTELQSLRSVFEKHLAEDHELVFVLAVPRSPKGIWVTVLDPTMGVNFYGIGSELSKAVSCRAWELANQDGSWTLESSERGRSKDDYDHHLGRASIARALSAALGTTVELPDPWDGELRGARVATVGRDCDWEQLSNDLGLAVAKMPKPNKASPQLKSALEAIYARPDDLRRRLSYAKLLTAAGDPRGEFIALDCAKRRTPAQGRRRAELLAKHERAWSAPFSDVFEWKGGFPESVAATGGPPGSHKAWSTVRSVMGASAALIASLPRVERATAISAATVKALSKKGKPLLVRELTITSDDERLLAVLTRARFPQLLHVNFEEAQGLTPAHIDFMQSRPGVRVSVGLDADEKHGPLVPFPAAKLEKLAAQLLRSHKAKEAKDRAKKLPPGASDVKKAVTTGDHLAVVQVLERAAISKPRLEEASLTVLTSTTQLDFMAACLGPFLRDLELSNDQWVDLAEGGVLLDNRAIRDVSLSKMRGPASPGRLKALEARTRGKEPTHERLRWLHERLTRPSAP